MNKAEIINGIVVYNDLRELERSHVLKEKSKKDIEKKWYAHEIPKLPDWTNRIYHYKQFQQNPFQLVCNCPEYQERSKNYIGRDFRKLCYHLYIKLTTTKIKEHLDELTLIILEFRFRYGQTKFYKNQFNGSDLILGFNDKNDWINVFLKEKDRWKKYSYSQKELRWRYRIEPNNPKLLLRRITEIQVWHIREK